MSSSLAAVELNRSEFHRRNCGSAMAENRKGVGFSLVSSLAIATLMGTTASADVGRMPGKFAVSPGGAATYTIPIALPAGPHGLAPEIALAYNSQGGDGLMGYGWDIAGLSRVERCPKSIATNGTRQAVSFSGGDQFCLDGNPLINTSSTAVYGANGTTYRPEVDDYRRVTSVGTAATNSPSYFKVERPNGRVYCYGSNANSRMPISSASNAEIRFWALTQIEDGKGNAIQFEYNNDVANGEFAPKEIRWSGHDIAGTPCSGTEPTGAHYKLAFTFSPRPIADVRAGYIQSAIWNRTQRLTNIAFKADNTIVRQFVVSYRTDANSGPSGHSKVESIQECSATTTPSNCLPATQFGWQLATAGWGPEVSSGQTYPATISSFITGDYNGDGAIDLFIPNDATGTWQIMLAHNGTYDAPVDTGKAFPPDIGPYSQRLSSSAKSVVIDYDGDGRADLLALGADGYWHVYISNGTANGANSFADLNTNLSYATVQNLSAVDFNGDGIDELVDLTTPGNLKIRTVDWSANGGFSPPLNTGYSIYGIGNVSQAPRIGTGRRLDLDGDGRNEFAYRYCVCYSFPTTGYTQNLWDNFYWTGTTLQNMPGLGAISGVDPTDHYQIISDEMLVGDFNGDGQSDVAWEYQDNSGIHNGISIGRGIGGVATGALPVKTELQAGFVGPNTRILDYNGDGRDDFLYPGYNTSNTTWTVRLSTGTTFDTTAVDACAQTTCTKWEDILGDYTCASCSSYYENHNKWGLIDVNGDGYPDIVLVRLSDQKLYVRLHTGPVRDVVTDVTDGLGYHVAIAYSNLNDSSVYTATGIGSASPPEYRLIRGGSTQVVKSVTPDNGDGTTRVLSWTYANGIRDTYGRGFVGFSKVTTTSSDANEPKLETSYLQQFPLTGRVSSQTTWQPGSTTKKLHSYSASWTAHPSGLNGRSQFVYSDSESSQDFDVTDGTTSVKYLTVSRPTSAWDWVHGAPGTETTSTSASPTAAVKWTTTRNFTYQSTLVSSTLWCLARPSTIDETRTAYVSTADQAAQSVSTSIIWLSFCEPNTITTGSTATTTDSRERLLAYYTYDAFGNVASINQSAVGSPAVGDGGNHHTDYEYGPTTAWPGYRETKESIVVVPGVAGCNPVPAQTLDTTYTWDYTQGLLQTVVPPFGGGTKDVYDAYGRPIEHSSLGDSGKTTIQYLACTACWSGNTNAVMQVHATVSGAVDYSENKYLDGLERIVGHSETLLDGSNSLAAMVYDSLGRITREEIPHVSGQAAGTFYIYRTYDVLGRIKTERRPADELTPATATPGTGAVTQIDYDGLKVTITDPAAHATTLYYDPIGTLAKVTDANLNDTIYKYAPFGGLSYLKDPTGHEATRSYSARGFLETVTDPDSGEKDLTYSALGDVLSEKDAAGATVSYFYDAAGRLTERDDKKSDGTAELGSTWTYYASGNGAGLLQSEQAGGYYQRALSYSASGNILQSDVTMYGTTYTSNFEYDNYGRVNAMTYPQPGTAGRPRFLYHYTDEAGSGFSKTGYPYKIEQDLGSGVTAPVFKVNSVDPLGRTATAMAGSATAYEKFQYDLANLGVAKIQTGTTSGGTDIQNFEYRWTPAGNLDWRKDNARNLTENFGYDSLNRLHTATVGSAVTTVNYGADGNISDKTGVGTYSYGQGSSFPHAVTGVTGARPSVYHYDVNGQMDCRGSTQSPCPLSNQITWFVSHLPKEIHKGVAYSQFVYGPERQLVMQSRQDSNYAGTLSYYIEPHFEMEILPSLAMRYRSTVFFGDQPVFMQIDQDYPSDSWQVTIHPDHLGSVANVVRSSGDAVSTVGTTRFSFDAWGKRRSPDTWANDTTDSLFSDNQFTEQGFTDHEHLDNVGLIHMNGRVQDPTLGLMLSPDPVPGALTDPQSWHPYAYVRHSPTIATDPSGLCNDWSASCEVVDPNPDENTSDTQTTSSTEIVVSSERRSPTPDCSSGVCDPVSVRIPEGLFTLTVAVLDGQITITTSTINWSATESVNGGSSSSGGFFSADVFAAQNTGPVGGDVLVGSGQQQSSGTSYSELAWNFAADLTGLPFFICVFDGCSAKNTAIEAVFFFGAAFGGELLNVGRAAIAARGTSRLGGIITSTTNSASGTVVSATGRVVGSDFAGAVNSGMLRGGPVNILSGAHGEISGVMRAERAFFEADRAAFGHLPGVNVFDVTRMAPGEISSLLRGPGTTVGAFCDSGACLAPFR